VQESLALGEVHWASLHYYWHAFPMLFQGRMQDVEALVGKLENIHAAFASSLSRLLQLLLGMQLLTECRRLPEARVMVAEGIEFFEKNGFPVSLVTAHACKASLHLMSAEPEVAGEALQTADNLRKSLRAVPYQLSLFHLNTLYYCLWLLENEMQHRDNPPRLFQARTEARTALRNALRNARKCAQHRVTIYYLAGKYFHLVGKRQKALNWWRRAIAEGNRLGARLELARAYVEIGHALRPKNENSPPQLDGKASEWFLDQAETLFTEMRLDWDLNRLERLRGR